MKHVNIIAFWLLVELSWIGSPLHAGTVTFENGVNIDLPFYQNKQINLDGSVCGCDSIECNCNYMFV